MPLMVRCGRFQMVVSYIYFTRIIVFLLGSTLPFRMAWVSTAATQVPPR